MAITDTNEAVKEIERIIASLTNLKNYLSAKSREKTEIIDMKEFLSMIETRVSLLGGKFPLKDLLSALEQARLTANLEGIVLSGGLFARAKPQTKVWWTTINSFGELLNQELDVSALLEVLSHKNRIKILKLLSEGSKPYKELSEELGLKGGAFAYHTSPLENMKCIEKKGRGEYAITPIGWEVLIVSLLLASRIRGNL
ncbi:MAG: winged helix-turn-helix transcriptional regulator [Candidatus Hodarchaeota archaeon]